MDVDLFDTINNPVLERTSRSTVLQVDGQATRVDREDFERIVKDAYPRLSQYALKLTRNPHEAADVVQSTLLRAYKARDKRLPGKSFDGWLFRIAYRCFLDGRYRSRHDRGVVSLETLGYMGLRYDPADPAANPEEEFFLAQYCGPIESALARLSAEQRSLIHLTHEEELSHKELASIFGCGATTVKTRIHRAHVALRSHLASMGFESSTACLSPKF